MNIFTQTRLAAAVLETRHLLALAALGLSLGACSVGGEPFSYTAIHEIPPGPGIISGNEGGYVITLKGGNGDTPARPAQPRVARAAQPMPRYGQPAPAQPVQHAAQPMPPYAQPAPVPVQPVQRNGRMVEMVTRQ